MLIFFYKSPPFVSQISPGFTADEWVLCCVAEFGCAAGRQSRSGTSVINAQQRAKQKSFDRRDSASFLRRCVSPHSHQGLDFTASGDASAPQSHVAIIGSATRVEGSINVPRLDSKGEKKNTSLMCDEAHWLVGYQGDMTWIFCLRIWFIKIICNNSNNFRFN